MHTTLDLFRPAASGAGAAPRITAWLSSIALALAGIAIPVQAAEPSFKVAVVDGESGIMAALKQARQRRASDNPPKGPVEIVLAPGEYVLSRALVLAANDSGTPTSPLIIKSDQPGTVRIVGGPRLKLKEDRGDSWSFEPPQKLDAKAERSGGQLFVNGRRAVLAREPNAGAYWLVAQADKTTFHAKPEDMTSLVSHVGNDSNRALIGLMQSWTSGKHHLDRIDRSGNVLEIEPKAKWGYLEYGGSQRWYLENVPGAWDAPGEWIAAQGAILFRPTTADGRGVDASQRANVYWPRLDTLLRVQGSPGRPVHDVRFENIAFAYSGNVNPDGSWLDGQAASETGAAIEIDTAARIAFSNCSISHTGGWAIWFNQSVQDSELTGCVLDDLGAGGVKIGSGLPLKRSQQAERIRVTDNVVTHVGREFPGGVGIWIGRSFDNEISSNIVAHTAYTGISVGWSWSFEDATSGGNKIIDNVLLDIGQQTLADLGGIYTLGRSPGTLIAGNFIREVDAYGGYGAGAWGLYNDEGSADLLVRNNVVVGTSSGGYQLNYGKDFEVRDNLLAGGRIAEVRWASVNRSGNWTFDGNAVEPHVGRGRFVYYNDDGKSARTSLTGLQAGKGADDVTVTVGTRLSDVTVTGADSTRVAKWRKVIDHARSLIDRATTAGVRGLETIERNTDTPPR